MTTKTTPKAFTPLELEIMNVLWDHGPSTVAEVQPRLRAELAYTTVMTMLNVLLRKQKVTRIQDGRAFRYRPAVTRRRATGSAVNDLVQRMFGGSTEALLMSLVETRGLTSADLDRMSRAIAEAEARDSQPAEDSPRPARTRRQEKKS